MRLLNSIIRYVVILLVIGCVDLFDTEPTDKDELFKLYVTHAIDKITDSAPINLSWDEITIENFYAFKIERHSVSETEWQLVTMIYDRAVFSHTDSVYDDEDIYYRIGIYDLDGNVRRAEASISIPVTRSLFIPQDYASIQAAFNSLVIDDGDTIYVAPGKYYGPLAFYEKEIFITSTEGPLKTKIQPEDDKFERVISMGSSTLSGFTIMGGDPANGQPGGGIYLAGNGTVKKCIIKENNSGGFGGGIFITEKGKLYNNIIYDNTSTFSGNGIRIQNAHGEIINNTIAHNSVAASGDLDLLVFRNNIVNDPMMVDFMLIDILSTKMMSVDYNCFDTQLAVGENNIFGDPDFIITNSCVFNINESSICISAGHPDTEYNNTDGSRNTIGAYGGPEAIEACNLVQEDL